MENAAPDVSPLRIECASPAQERKANIQKLDANVVDERMAELMAMLQRGAMPGARPVSDDNAAGGSKL
ncbi:MAG: hypothetical protein P4M09_00590 [Devosia sp.]|nr:hypothetical protein [Devosia sp.]